MVKILRIFGYSILGVFALLSVFILFFYFSKQQVVEDSLEVFPAQRVLVKPSFKPQSYLEYNVASGDGFEAVLAQFGMQTKDIILNRKAFKKLDLYKMNYLEEMAFHYKIKGDLEELEKIVINKKSALILIEKQPDGTWQTSKLEENKVIKNQKFIKLKTSGVLSENYYNLKVPNFVYQKLRNLYLLRDEFKINLAQSKYIIFGYYEVLDQNKQKLIDSDVFYVNLENSALKNYEIFGYKVNEQFHFLNETGESFEKLLNIKPTISSARLTSSFGMRKHPILGIYRMHAGIDYGVPKGTPIYAAGDGTVTFKGVYGGYGNYIRIRHSSGLSTAYAHLSRYASKLKSGKKVKKGELIGYVGNTGLSLGAHLHFEILRNGRAIDPLKISLPARISLKGKELKEFKTYIFEIKKNRRKALSDKNSNDYFKDVFLDKFLYLGDRIGI